MRKWLLTGLAALAPLVACTQDFDQFSVGGGSGGTAAGDGDSSSAGASGAGAGGRDASAGSPSDGAAGMEAGQDAPSDGPEDAPAEGPLVCPPGSKPCNATCVLETDVAFGCATAACDPCPAMHATAACDTTGACSITDCDAGWQNCNMSFFDGCETYLATSASHCGACNTTCNLPNATASCVNAQCNIASCNFGWRNCDADVATGCETNTSSDPAACGSCTNDCTANPGEWTCEMGICTPSICPAGSRDCDGNGSCETDVTVSSANCGFCGNACTVANGQGQCESSVCVVDSCNAPFEDCDGLFTTGCEANTASNISHCGACGRGCSGASIVVPQCSGGLCTSTCSVGRGNCAQPMAPAADDGCEENILTDAANCGACGRACSMTNATAVSCSAGSCTATCSAGQSDCTHPLPPAPDNGCETDSSDDVINCGGCGRLCSANGVASLTCAAGLCASTCVAGRGNCTQPTFPTLDNGCETLLGTDKDNCGACGRACSTNNASFVTCGGGLCSPTCDPSFGSCTTPVAPAPDNGCETNLATSLAHCGGCGRACSNFEVQTRTCQAGLCTSTCTAGNANCDLPANPTPDDGCESDLQVDVDHCGECGRPCSFAGVSTRSCTNGACDSSCSSGSNCGQPSAPAADDGCEANLQTNAQNCGACGRACSATSVTARACSAGECRSFCDLGRENCTFPPGGSADDGCELSNANTRCGGCGNDCVQQGAGSGFTCGSAGPSICGCTSDTQCEGGSSNASCSAGLCTCLTVGTDPICRPGETCEGTFTNSACRCNGVVTCAPNQICCFAPSGCFDVSNDPNNCGACGHACAPGFVCVPSPSGRCECNDNGDCNGGAPGTCSGGLCMCPATCAAGERCLPSGACG